MEGGRMVSLSLCGKFARSILTVNDLTVEVVVTLKNEVNE